ncbi:MAG: alanine racemase [Eggerthella lenta]
MGFKRALRAHGRRGGRLLQACGRDPKSVVVVAVSKTVGADEVAEAIEAGAHDQARTAGLPRGKRARFPQQTWHFIGNIQSRRIPDIVRDAALVHSLYQQRHVPKFDAAAAASGKVQDVLLEVNVSGEASKSGLAPSEVAGMLEYCAGFPHVRVRGLMTMAPQGDAQRARACFADLARLRDEVRLGLDGEQAAVFDELSMGMSEDWHEAIAEARHSAHRATLFDDAPSACVRRGAAMTLNAAAAGPPDENKQVNSMELPKIKKSEHGMLGNQINWVSQT